MWLQVPSKLCLLSNDIEISEKNNFQVGLHQRKLTDQHDISDQLLSNSGDSLQMLDSEFVWVMDFYFVK
jgi:hypothetical protein